MLTGGLREYNGRGRRRPRVGKNDGAVQTEGRSGARYEGTTALINAPHRLKWMYVMNSCSLYFSIELQCKHLI